MSRARLADRASVSTNEARRAVHDLLTSKWEVISGQNTGDDLLRALAFYRAWQVGGKAEGANPKTIAEAETATSKLVLTAPDNNELKKLITEASHDRLAWDACWWLVEKAVGPILGDFVAMNRLRTGPRPRKQYAVQARKIYGGLAMHICREHGLRSPADSQLVSDVFNELHRELGGHIKPAPMTAATMLKDYEQSHLRDDKKPRRRSKPRAQQRK